MNAAPAPNEQPPPDGTVPADDAVIGRAFRISLLALLAVGALVGLGLWLAAPDATPPPRQAPTIAEPGATVQAQGAPRVRFTDVTRAAGIAFVHVNGARGGKYLPETMGGGCAFFDADGDGDQDLLFVNGAAWPWDVAGERPASPPALYRNDGTGRFEDVTATAGLDATFYGTGVACGDVDGDGDVELLISGVGENRLYRNDGGRFVDVTDAAGVRGAGDAWNTSAGFCDLDRDGDLDLFVCRYVKWSRAIDEAQNYTLAGVGRAYGPPTTFEGADCVLFRNEGDGTFTDVSAEAGIRVGNPATGLPVGKSLGVLFEDLDGDGDADVFVANDTVRNFLFENRGGLGFEEIGERAGVAYDSRGAATGAMGVDAASVRDDGFLGVAVGNFASEMSSLYLARGRKLQFTDAAISEGVGAPSRKALSFGLFFFDYDLDGRMDLFQTNGHLEEEINRVQPSQNYEQASQLFWNAGPEARAAYALVDEDTVGDLARKVVGRACAYADIDGDGDLDLAVTQCGRGPLLLRNDQALGHHWLRVVLVPRGGRSPIGAQVVLRAGGREQRRLVSPTRSYLSQVELPVTFGLGRAARVDGLAITWPDGSVQAVTVEGIDRMLVVRQP